ncbi:hypothetical protein GGH94_000477 [Coemansia aciculifera]|uniref:C2H2-type domain-containing protein n=1 Tax=Coemansia aciculifera TaxID=417176 RepID=A0A9W8M7U5_9FUNG|nr:hypothetical protein GGH94_000477 [Coemansia aciculifera]
MPFDEEEPRSASEAPALGTGSGWGEGAAGLSANSGSGWGVDADAQADSPRDKFRRDRDSPERRDRFGRDRRSRSRSRSPADMRMPRRRSRSPTRRQPGADDSDRYIPHYDRESGGDRGDRYQQGGAGRYGNRGYNGGRGNRPSNRDVDGPYSGGGGGDMMGNRAGGLLDPRTFEQVVPFKYFAEWLKSQDNGRRLDQDEVKERYEDYRREALQRLYTQFFSAHKDEDWFTERFDPERRKVYMQHLAEHKAARLRDFMSDLESGKLDKLTYTATTEQVMQHEIHRRDQSGYGRMGIGEDDEDLAISHTLFIRTVPPSVSRETLESHLKDLPGYKYLALSEPRQDKQYHRFGWARFENGTDMDKALESLGNVNIDQFQFHFSRHTNSAAAAMRLAPDVASSDERIRHDLKLVREAVQSLDERTDPATFHSFATLQEKAKEISAAAGERTSANDAGKGDNEDGAEDGEDAPMADVEKKDDEKGAAEGSDEPTGDIASARRELDLMLEYLRRVHYYCYYCGHTADNSEDFSRRCAKLHLRRGLPSSRSPMPSGNWIRNLDNRNDVIIHPLEAERLFKEGGKSLERETDKELDNHIKCLDEGRFRCLLCTKLFKGDAFVRKHIRNKHPEAVPETLVREISYFNNFVREAPNFVQLGTGSVLPAVGGMGGGMMNSGGGGGGMRDRGSGYMPQMMPGMMMPGMMAAPYMMPGMVPGMMPGMMQMGGHFMNPGMMGMMGGDRGGQGMYNQQYRGGGGGVGRGNSNGNAPPGGRGDMRPVRSYVDLDAPAEGDADFGF